MFRSTDGGATWSKVLYKDENTGARDVAFDPSNPHTVYAVLWAARQYRLGVRRVERPGQRALSIHRRRQHWKQLIARAADVRRRPGSDRAWRSRRAIRNRMYARVEADRRRLLSLRRRGRDLEARQRRRARLGRGGDFSRSQWIPRIPTSCMSRTPSRTSPSTAARPSPPSGARRAATTITASGSIRTNPEHHRCWASTRARRSR